MLRRSFSPACALVRAGTASRQSLIPFARRSSTIRPTPTRVSTFDLAIPIEPYNPDIHQMEYTPAESPAPIKPATVEEPNAPEPVFYPDYSNREITPTEEEFADDLHVKALFPQDFSTPPSSTPLFAPLSSTSSLAPLLSLCDFAHTRSTPLIRREIELPPFQDKSRPPNEPMLTDEQSQILDTVRRGHNVFFTGAAGTGKSVLMRAIVRALKEDGKVVGVTATTGIAAQNLGISMASTLHSWAGVSVRSSSAKCIDRVDALRDYMRSVKGKSTKETAALRKPRPSTPTDFAIQRWLGTHVLIIDEVSMLSAELFDRLDALGKDIRNNSLPFGGLQIVVAGDFYQLPPVEKDIETDAARGFAFTAHNWQAVIKKSNNFFLRKVHRQADPVFVGLLNRLRLGKVSMQDVETLKSLDREIVYEDGIEPISLFSLVEDVERRNQEHLASIKAEERSFEAVDDISGIRKNIVSKKASFGDLHMLTSKLEQDTKLAKTLKLKVGVSVMVVKNMDIKSTGSIKSLGSAPTQDKEDIWRLSNGLQGKVVSFHESGDPVVSFIDGTTIRIPRYAGEVRDSRGMVMIRRNQYPLVLAAAITIHKSQGQTLQRVKIDLRNTFERGQAYVALSRATSLSSIELRGFNPLASILQPNPEVFAFMQRFAEEPADDLEPLSYHEVFANEPSTPPEFKLPASLSNSKWANLQDQNRKEQEQEQSQE
ncbi:DNA helicase PIF1/RRM3 [Phaffia rhodozyma]|uniref:ATP-dependent DNA helicase n=1 Tax=Phaffia rhodozyma TaxID=264483 RepID=A0A0F7SSC4_PHARH|nr:DNA helicase PIF1/RRM3 [Phaffia rhodozyma]